MSDSSWDRDFERLRVKYRDKLREQIATLGEKLRKARESQSARCELDSACKLAHSMKGTSGTYGFDEISAALESIETKLDELIETPSADTNRIWVDIERALHHARTRLD